MPPPLGRLLNTFTHPAPSPELFDISMLNSSWPPICRMEMGKAGEGHAVSHRRKSCVARDDKQQSVACTRWARCMRVPGSCSRGRISRPHSPLHGSFCRVSHNVPCAFHSWALITDTIASSFFALPSCGRSEGPTMDSRVGMKLGAK